MRLGGSDRISGSSMLCSSSGAVSDRFWSDGWIVNRHFGDRITSLAKLHDQNGLGQNDKLFKSTVEKDTSKLRLEANRLSSKIKVSAVCAF